MKKGRLLLLSILVLLAAGGIWWSLSRPAKFPGPFLLPDSNRVHLVAVTVGTNAKVHFGTPIERVLARLPAQLGKRFRQNEISDVSHRSAGADILLWFRYDRLPPAGTYLRASLLPQGDGPNAPTRSVHPRTLSNGVTVAHSGTHLWPRRNRTLTFRVEQVSQPSHQGITVGELTVANPAYADYPIWVPEKLPATRNFKNAEFTLEAPIGRHESRVRVMSEGRPAPSWEVWSHWVRDATGNLVTRSDMVQTPMRHRADELGVIRVPTQWFGMPREPAWKIGLQFVRPGVLASNEVFVLRGVPATSTGRWPATDWKTNLPVGLVQLRHQPDWDDPSRRPCLVPDVPEIVDLGAPERTALAITILGAVDDTGQRIPVVDDRKIHIPPGSKTLDITIGIPPQYCVEYAVDPKTLDEPEPDYQKIPDTIRPEKILRELKK